MFVAERNATLQTCREVLAHRSGSHGMLQDVLRLLQVVLVYRVSTNAYFKDGIQPKCVAQAEEYGAEILEMWSPDACEIG